ncbi:MAG: primosomal protein N' [Chloroflexi bacterium]|nr:primosomal protein N' [Chloroflexota bacterium]
MSTERDWELTRPVHAVIDPGLALLPHQLSLARWVSEYYRTSLFSCAALMFPPGFHARVVPYVLSTVLGDQVPEGLGEGQEEILEFLQRRGRVKETDLLKALGSRAAARLRALVQRGLVLREWEAPRPRTGFRHVDYLSLTVEEIEARRLAAVLAPAAPRQGALLVHLAEVKEHPVSLLRRLFGPAAVEGLSKRGLVRIVRRRLERDPLAGYQVVSEPAVTLTPQQGEATQAVARALGGETRERAFLLYGVTGSGKTEVYLDAASRTLAAGKSVIFLLPEIALTPQAVQRLMGRFPGRVALYHSGLTPGQQVDQWWRIRETVEPLVVVGSRGAVFAPVKDPGLIVMDEEHEWTYKQHDAAPRYHAREVALKLCELTGAVFLAGSATPDVATYYRALHGQYRLLELGERVGRSSAGGPRPLPRASVQVVDMRQELREGNRSVFSRDLKAALDQALGKGEQAILFLNRRGAAPLVQCRECGQSMRCRRCDMTLTYHAIGPALVCHLCGRRSPVPATCPTCGSARIRYLGLGTQKLVEEVGRAFPGVSVLRWDRDVAKGWKDHLELMERFSRGQAQVLVGTQMVAKGLHLPRVTVVGVILADLGMGLPDYRAPERTFQLLCQVAGRAGREELPGRVIIQTYMPESYAIRLAGAQDYRGFFDAELLFRRRHLNPPFGRLVRFLFAHPNAVRSQQEAERLARSLRDEKARRGLTDDVLGPTPAYPSRVRGRYRWHVLLRGRDPETLLDAVTLHPQWLVDLDPVALSP